jgi:hypothetical protein
MENWVDPARVVTWSPSDNRLQLEVCGASPVQLPVDFAGFLSLDPQPYFLDRESPTNRMALDRDKFHAWAYANGLRHDSPPLAALAIKPPDPVGRVAAVDMIEILSGFLRDSNSCFLDATTIDTVRRLLRLAHPLEPKPHFIFDLSVFVTGVLLFDNVYHLPGIMTQDVNRALEAEVLRPLPLRGERTQWHLWHLAMDAVARFPSRAPGDIPSPLTYSASELERMTGRWETLTGDKIPEFSAESHTALKGILGFRTPPAFVDVYHEQFMQDGRTDVDFLVAATARTLFNRSLCVALGIPYLASGVRSPMNELFTELEASGAGVIDHALEYLASTVGVLPPLSRLPKVTNVALPSLLTAVMAELSSRSLSLDAFLATLGELRRAGREYRESLFKYRRLVADRSRQKEADEAFYAAASLYPTWLKHGSGAPAWSLGLVRDSAGVTGPYKAAYDLGATVLLSLAKAGRVGELLAWLYRPEHAFVLQINREAASVRNANAEIARLWGRGLSSDETKFLERLEEQWKLAPVAES